MSSKGGGSNAPKPLDPKAVANAQAQSNLSTAVTQATLNNTNQVNPWGSSTYSQTGTYKDPVTGMMVPRYTQTTTLSPDQQKIFDVGEQTQLGMANLAQRETGDLSKTLNQSLTAPSYTQYGQGPKLDSTIDSAGNIQRSLGTNDFSGDRQRVEDALMGRLNTQSDRDRGALEQRLANQGIAMGSSAYTRAMGDFDKGLSENRTNAILGAGTEQNRLQQLALNAGNFANTAQAQQFGQNLASTGFSNDALQQMFGNNMAVTGANNQLSSQRLADQMGIRNQGINEVSALRSGSQVGMPQFQGTPQTGVAGTDIAGIMNNSYNQQMGQYQQGQQDQNNMWSSIGGIAAAGLPLLFSDERLKTNIKPTGGKVAEVPVKSWQWKGSMEPDVGVVAQDVERRHPNMVMRDPATGYRKVNYAGLMRLGSTAKMRRAA